MTWVIVLIEDNELYRAGLYVAPPGSSASYTEHLEAARTFSTKEKAESYTRGNERAMRFDSFARLPE